MFTRMIQHGSDNLMSPYLKFLKKYYINDVHKFNYIIMSKKEVNVNEVREQIAEYLTRAERGEETIIKRYTTKIAKIVPYEEKSREKLPDLSEFRESLGVSSGQPAGELLREMRNNDW